MKKSELQQIIKEEIHNVLNEGSFTDQMDDSTRKLYFKYYRELELHNWDEKVKELKQDSEYLALPGIKQRLISKALSALHHQMVRMER